MRKITREEHEVYKEHYEKMLILELQCAIKEAKQLEEAINDANWSEIKYHFDNLLSVVQSGHIEYERMMREVDAINREVKV